MTGRVIRVSEITLTGETQVSCSFDSLFLLASCVTRLGMAVLRPDLIQDPDRLVLNPIVIARHVGPNGHGLEARGEPPSDKARNEKEVHHLGVIPLPPVD